MKLSVGLFGYDLLNIINHAFIDSYVHCNYYKARGCWSERGMLIAIREEGWGAAGRGVEGLNRKGKKRDALVCVWAQGQIWCSHKSWEGDARQNRAVISQNVNYPYSFSFCCFFSLWTVNLGWIRSYEANRCNESHSTLPEERPGSRRDAWHLLPGISLRAQGLLASPLNSKRAKNNDSLSESST